MITAGIDIGSMSADTVILQVNDEKDEGTIVGSSIILTGANSAETAKKTMDIALKDAGVKFEEIDFIVSTGYGRIIVPFSNKNITEISCHAKGAHWFFPSVHTIVDMGGQDCKVITCDDVGKVTSFVMNDKCAAGAGRSMTFIGELLNVPLESIGKSSFEIVQKEAAISSTCVLFASKLIESILADHGA